MSCSPAKIKIDVVDVGAHRTRRNRIESCVSSVRLRKAPDCVFSRFKGRVANFGSHALLHKGTELALIVDLDDLLRSIGRVGDVELHLDGGARSRLRRGLVVDKRSWMG